MRRALSAVFLSIMLAAPMMAQQAPPAGRESEAEKLDRLLGPQPRQGLVTPRYADPRNPPAVTLGRGPETQTFEERFFGHFIELRPNVFVRSRSPCRVEPDPKNPDRKIVVCDGAPSTSADKTPARQRPKLWSLPPRHPGYGKGKLYPATPL